MPTSREDLEVSSLLKQGGGRGRKGCRLCCCYCRWCTCCCNIPKRFIFVALCFLGNTLSYMDRTNMSIAILPMATEFNWSNTETGYLLSAFFYGYLLTQIPGALLAKRFGGKAVLGTCVVLWSVFTALSPPTAGIFYLTMAVRFLVGLAEGVSLPTIHHMMAQWIPPAERSRAVTMSTSGQLMGMCVAMGSSPFINYSWRWSFYVFAVCGVVWYAFWQLLVYSSPVVHPTISREEREYIARALGKEVAASTWSKEGGGGGSGGIGGGESGGGGGGGNPRGSGGDDGEGPSIICRHSEESVSLIMGPALDAASPNAHSHAHDRRDSNYNNNNYQNNQNHNQNNNNHHAGYRNTFSRDYYASIDESERGDRDKDRDRERDGDFSSSRSIIGLDVSSHHRMQSDDVIDESQLEGVEEEEGNNTNNDNSLDDDGDHNNNNNNGGNSNNDDDTNAESKNKQQQQQQQEAQQQAQYTHDIFEERRKMVQQHTEKQQHILHSAQARKAAHKTYKSSRRDSIGKISHYKTSLPRNPVAPPPKMWVARDFIKEPAMWAVCIAHFCHNWGYYVLLSWLPKYLKEVWLIDTGSVGLYALGPYLCMFACSNLSGWLSDCMLKSHPCGITFRAVHVRKIMQTVAFVSPITFLLLIRSAQTREMAMTCLIFAIGLSAFSHSGYFTNVLDISPRHAGHILGITNTFGSVPGIVGNVVTGWMLEGPNGWDLVFITSCCIYGFGLISFLCFAKGHVIFE